MSFFSLGIEAWGVEVPWMKNPPRDITSCGFGDPRQILTDVIGTHPIAEGGRKGSAVRPYTAEVFKRLEDG